MTVLRMRRRRASAKSPSDPIVLPQTGSLEATDRDPDDVRAWIAFWDADRQHVAVTGEHLGSVMWNDDGAVGVRGWYY
jgi:hypothetical protein